MDQEREIKGNRQGQLRGRDLGKQRRNSNDNKEENEK
jgi:hypothetical protein